MWPIFDPKKKSIKKLFNELVDANVSTASVIYRERKYKKRPKGFVNGRRFMAYHDGLHSLYMARDVFHSMLGVVDTGKREFVAHNIK